MEIQAQFYLNQLRTQIALQDILKSWQPSIQSPIECPFCQSEQVSQYLIPQQGKTHRCQSCQQDFSEEWLSECRCLVPGRLQKCQNCPQFQSILPKIQERALSLRAFSQQELYELARHNSLNNLCSMKRTM